VVNVVDEGTTGRERERGRLMPALAKPAKGTAILERRKRRATRDAFEKSEKAKVVKRDGSHYCRLVPGCREKEKHETAHVNSKGMGGDHGIRSTADQMIRSCLWHHRGNWSLHSGDLRVEFLTDKGADGPIQVMATDADDQPYVLGREIRVGQWESD
jgi:hypothetical protein